METCEEVIEAVVRGEKVQYRCRFRKGHEGDCSVVLFWDWKGDKFRDYSSARVGGGDSMKFIKLGD